MKKLLTATVLIVLAGGTTAFASPNTGCGANGRGECPPVASAPAPAPAQEQAQGQGQAQGQAQLQGQLQGQGQSQSSSNKNLNLNSNSNRNSNRNSNSNKNLNANLNANLNKNSVQNKIDYSSTSVSIALGAAASCGGGASGSADGKAFGFNFGQGRDCKVIDWATTMYGFGYKDVAVSAMMDQHSVGRRLKAAAPAKITNQNYGAGKVNFAATSPAKTVRPAYKSCEKVADKKAVVSYRFGSSVKTKAIAKEQCRTLIAGS